MRPGRCRNPGAMGLAACVETVRSERDSRSVQRRGPAQRLRLNSTMTLAWTATGLLPSIAGW